MRAKWHIMWEAVGWPPNVASLLFICICYTIDPWLIFPQPFETEIWLWLVANLFRTGGCSESLSHLLFSVVGKLFGKSQSWFVGNSLGWDRNHEPTTSQDPKSKTGPKDKTWRGTWLRNKKSRSQDQRIAKDARKGQISWKSCCLSKAQLEQE